MPADVATYAIGKSPRTPADNRHDQVEFQVVRWDEEDGLTVVHKFDQAPGQIIGTKYSTRVPNDKKDKIVSREYDYTSHQVLADALGGDRPASEIQGLGVPKFEAPVLALVVRPDGMLVVRDQAVDTTNGERDEMKDIYDQIMKEVQAGKKKSSSTLMGGYGGAWAA